MTTFVVIVVLLIALRKPIFKLMKWSFKLVATIFIVAVAVTAFRASDFYSDLLDLNPDLPEGKAIVEGAKEIGKDFIIVSKEVARDGYNDLVERGIKFMNDTIR